MRRKVDRETMKIPFDGVRILLKEGELTVQIMNEGIASADLVRVFCGGSLDLSLPLRGTIQATLTTA